MAINIAEKKREEFILIESVWIIILFLITRLSKDDIYICDIFLAPLFKKRTRNEEKEISRKSISISFAASYFKYIFFFFLLWSSRTRNSIVNLHFIPWRSLSFAGSTLLLLRILDPFLEFWKCSEAKGGKNSVYFPGNRVGRTIFCSVLFPVCYLLIFIRRQRWRPSWLFGRGKVADKEWAEERTDERASSVIRTKFCRKDASESLSGHHLYQVYQIEEIKEREKNGIRKSGSEMRERGKGFPRINVWF